MQHRRHVSTLVHRVGGRPALRHTEQFAEMAFEIRLIRAANDQLHNDDLNGKK